MSYSLEFLTVDFNALHKFFAQGDEQVRQTVIETGDQIYPDPNNNDEEMQDARFVWKEIVNSLSGGKLGQYLAAQKRFGLPDERNDRMSKAKSLAFAAIVRHYAESIACVSHSVNSGEEFRVEPFEYLKEFRLLGRIDPLLLLSRPVLNQTPDSFPCWGGLSRDELAAISLNDLTGAQADSGDSDVDTWVNKILDLTEEAKLRENDLITLYE